MLPYLEWERLQRRRGRSSSRRAASSTRCARSRTRTRSRSSAARRRSPTAALEALTAETWVGRSRARARLAAARAAARARRRRALVRLDRRVGRERREAARRIPTDKIVERGTLVTVDWGVRVDGYCSDCTRTFSTGRLPDRLREAYDVCLDAQQRGVREHQGRADRRRGRRARARPDRGRRLRRELRPRPRPRRRPRDPRGAAALDRVDRHARRRPLRHDRAGHLPARARRRADRGPRDRPRRRRRAADELPEGADRGRDCLTPPVSEPVRLPSCADGRGRRNQPVPERDAHRARRADLAHRRVPAREAGQGRRLRAHQAEVARLRLGRRPDVPRRREVPARSHRAEEHAVPLRLGRRGRVHGRVDLRAALAAARADRGRAAVHAAVVVRAGDVRRRARLPGSTCPPR